MGGIIGYINDNYYNDLHNIVRVSTSSTFKTKTNSDWCYPESIVDFKSTKSWASDDKENSSATIYFPSNRVSITHYTFMTKPYPDNLPLSWMLEGSMDNLTWTTLHSKYDSTDLNYAGAIKRYQVDVNGVFKYFKVSQTGPNSGRNHLLHLQRFDLFGSLCNEHESCVIPLFCSRYREIQLSTSFLSIILFNYNIF